LASLLASLSGKQPSLPYSYQAPWLKLELRPRPANNRALATEAWLIIPIIGSQLASLIDVKTYMPDEHQVRELKTAKPSAVRSQRLCLWSPPCRVLGRHALGFRTGNGVGVHLRPQLPLEAGRLSPRRATIIIVRLHSSGVRELSPLSHFARFCRRWVDGDWFLGGRCSCFE
jgi:hypothetical protein